MQTSIRFVQSLAVCQAPSIVNVPAPSRASSLPQGRSNPMWERACSRWGQTRRHQT
ncbi:EamA domain-containing protein [Pseudomonas sp. IT-P291]